MDTSLPKRVAQKMLGEDAFSQWLGIEILACSHEVCELGMSITSEMLNGFKMVHGGVLTSLADSALAFLANSSGFITVTTDLNSSYLKPCQLNEKIRAKASIISRGKKVVHIQVDVFNTKNEKKAFFKGVAYTTDKKHST